MDDQNKNLFLALALSLGVILVWTVFIQPPAQTTNVDEVAEETLELAKPSDLTATTPGAAPSSSAQSTPSTTTQVEDAPRLKIETDRLIGSISLAGGRIDDLKLKDYRVSIEKGADIVRVLSPVGSERPYYALYGWAPGQGLSVDDVPGSDTLWTIQPGQSDETLSETNPVTLTWSSPAGLTFTRKISVDDNYMFTVEQNVTNSSTEAVTLAPYGVLARLGEPADLKNFFILHEGFISTADGITEHLDYGDMRDLDVDTQEGGRADVTRVEKDGWIGFTDHYWMSVMIPSPGEGFKEVAKYDEARDTYQAEAIQPTTRLEAGENRSVTTQLFSGAKEWDTIRAYQNTKGRFSSLFGAPYDPNKPHIDRFVETIDWGWFSFLTKPIFFVLHWLHKAIGNMGWSIICLTLMIKALLFPLALKSFVSMAKMKKLQPEMEKVKERAGDDRQKMQQEMMQLYKTEKVNPAAGCLPMLVQIPIFFSLYKVIFVTLELRQAPWFGPFQDLSSPDPTSLYNLFGLLPWGAPEAGSILALAFIGILPLLLGISMWLQQKLNPAPTDPAQAMIFAWMPWVFMFMLGGFASGLVVYWIANNSITFSQQYIIMRSQGAKPNVFGNITSSFKKKKETKS